MVRVKGSTVTSRIRYVRETFGEDGLARLMQSLPPDLRAWVDTRVLPTQWLPYDLFIELLVQADRLFGRGDLGLCRPMAHFSADVNLTSFYRIFYKLGSPAFILKRAARLWQMHYDSGALQVAEDEPGKVRLLIRDFERPHRAHCFSVLGWAERSAELSGARILYSDETRCRTRGDSFCELSVSFEG